MRDANEGSKRVDTQPERSRAAGLGEDRAPGALAIDEELFKERARALAEIRNKYPDPQEEHAALTKYFEKIMAEDRKRRAEDARVNNGT